MTQNEKKLLFKDLCMRLPYGVKVEIKYHDDAWELLAIYTNGTTYAARDIGYPIETYFEDCKPYLFPLSSITYEQKCTCPIGVANLEDFIENNHWSLIEIQPYNLLKFGNWCYKNHLDVNGLIPMGLAIDASGLNIY